MPTTYPLRDEPGRTKFVFEKHGLIYGHIVKNRTDKELAKLVFETEKFDSVGALKADIQ